MAPIKSITHTHTSRSVHRHFFSFFFFFPSPIYAVNAHSWLGLTSHNFRWQFNKTRSIVPLTSHDHIERELRANANFSAPTIEPAHEVHVGQRAALLVQLSQLQVRCSISISGPQARSPRSELSAMRAANNVIAFSRADRNLSS